jgi:hypothetical protein
VALTYSQDGNLQLGKSNTQPSAAVYDLSDPTGVNMEVSLWGFVRFPGRYKLPVTTTFMDLMSYAGGPLENSNLEEIRIVSGATDTSVKNKRITKLNYNDVMWEDKVKVDSKRNPVLLPNDVIIVMEERRYTFRDNLMYVLPIISAVISIITFIITLKK